MSISDYISGNAAWSWLIKRSASRFAPEARQPDGPSLASVEYELSQLRLSLRGVVDFGDNQPGLTQVDIQLSRAASHGLVRHYDLQHKILSRD